MPLLSCYTPNLIEAGLDEAGRGCLAGPVVAAAVILPRDFRHPLLNDSKQMTAKHRDELREVILERALCWAVAKVDTAEIDRINILWASVKAMHLAVDQLQVRPELLLVDGNRFRPYPFVAHQCVVQGDATYSSIAAASVLAKTHRDELMRQLGQQYPGYGWEKNAGYGTPVHCEGIKKLGLTPLHRKTFRQPLPQACTQTQESCEALFKLQ